jgi:luciferase family oxidoreductase group 1
MMQNFSLLDLSPIPEDKTAAEALAETVDLARAAERFGYHRFWLAEHHNMPGIASAATAVVIGHMAAATRSIRVGAGGIMLPNHAPLVVAEQSGTLATLFPRRIDLGLGRAPGTDTATARVLRRHMVAEDSFPRNVQELIGHLAEDTETAQVRAIPGVGTHVPVWILGSSLYGAQLAAYHGLPYAFASHFAPALPEQALAIYRGTFQPSEWLEKPHVMIAAGVCAADTDAEAAFLRSSQLLAFARLRSGRPGKLPSPRDDLDREIPAPVMAQVQQALSCSATGSAATVRCRLMVIVAAPQAGRTDGDRHDPRPCRTGPFLRDRRRHPHRAPRRGHGRVSAGTGGLRRCGLNRPFLASGRAGPVIVGMAPQGA